MKENLVETNFVSVTAFSKGKAPKIFRELEEGKDLLVMKNNRPIAKITKVITEKK